MATPSLALFPSGIKASKVYSVLPTDGSGDFDFSRASSATRVNSEGLIELVTSNVPRLNYPLIDGVVQGCPSLLLEPQRININTFSDPTDAQKGSTSYASVTYQDDFNWGLGNVINNAIVFGDNSTTRYAYYNSTVVSGTEYTLSFFIKMDDNSVPIPATDFLLVLAGTSIASGHTIDNYGNNVYRVSVSETAGASNTANGVLKVASHSAKTFKITGFQIEAGSYATSYIPTSGATATRVGESCSQTPPSGIIGQTEGTIFVDVNNQLVSPANDTRIQLSDGTTDKWILIGVPGGSIGGLAECYVNNFATSFTMTFNSSVALSIGRNKVAFAYKSGDFVLYINGISVGSSSATGTIPSCSQLKIGGNTPTSTTKETQQFNEFVLFPTRLTNAELAALTT
jgi:hypothetical protein